MFYNPSIHGKRWAVAKKVATEFRIETNEDAWVRFARKEATSCVFEKRFRQKLETETLVDIAQFIGL